jgi:hypothetical protein
MRKANHRNLTSQAFGIQGNKPSFRIGGMWRESRTLHHWRCSECNERREIVHSWIHASQPILSSISKQIRSNL